MIRKSPQYDTTKPPGQIINFEVPLVRAAEAFRGDDIDGLRVQVRELRKELRYEREQRTFWYLDAMKYKAMVEKMTKFP